MRQVATRPRQIRSYSLTRAPWLGGDPDSRRRAHGLVESPIFRSSEKKQIVVHDASELEADLGDLAPFVVEELRTGWHASMVNAEMRQRRIKAASDRLADARRTVEGIGQHTMSVDYDSYIFWNQQLPGCWRDKGFREEFAKANPHTRVQSTTAPTIINPGLATA